MATVAAPADKRFRRAQVKPTRKRHVGAKQVWVIAKLTMVLAVALYGGWRGTALVLGAPALQVSRITVRGNHRLSTGEVLAIVDGLHGRNILTVSLGEWQQRLLASPWVEAAVLRRVLPSRVDVVVRERRPIGIGRLGSTLYLVDAAGVVIDEYGPNYAEFDLPIIDGLTGRPSDTSSAIDEGRARLASRVLAALEARPDIAKRVSQIDVTDSHDAVVLLEGDTAMLRLGSEEFVERIQEYLDLGAALRERVADIDYVDLRFDDRLYVRPVKK
ncbi:MAG TPA: FtsQ-type POTRA domain-containing protein [Vicinamibacterales bacterium]|nr:FtsQ-type POTRA domain-containing protein [Vicinamibacterales bacterium]